MATAIVALLAVLVGVEAALRAGPRVRSGEPVRILCLGDSVTYGLFLEPHESYPAQLEALWNASRERPKIEVLNLGMRAGLNSSWLLAESSRLLDVFEPDLVILMVGANDFWTKPLPAGPGDGLGARLRRTGIARALARATSNGEAKAIETRMTVGGEPLEHAASKTPEKDGAPIDLAERVFEARYGDEAFVVRLQQAEPGGGGNPDSLRRNLGALVGRVRQRGVEVVLMSYPSQRVFYDQANRTMRAFAADRGVPLVDVDARFRRRCQDEACLGLLFPNGHPKASGYHEVAEALAAWLSGSELAKAR